MHLRAAIEETNTVVGADGIIFRIPASDPGCTAGVCTINLGSELPHITDGVTITGPGPDKLTVRRDTGGNYSVFTVEVSIGRTVTISGLTITNGGGTGAFQLFGRGTINVTNCVITNNFRSGIYNLTNGALVNITNCTISNNSGVGGINNQPLDSILNVTNTISGNFGGDGAGRLIPWHDSSFGK